MTAPVYTLDHVRAANTPLWLDPVEDVSPVRWRVTVALGIAFIIQCIILWRP